MIHRSLHTVEESDWKQLLSEADISLNELCRYLELPQQGSDTAAKTFRLRVPAPYLARIEKGNAEDPLLRQILPIEDELISKEGFVADPLMESQFSTERGLIHKYKSRVLLIMNGSCGIHCRYCFRREFAYTDHRNSRHQWQQRLEYIRTHPEVNEVILSGGDPLTAPDRYLEEICRMICSLPQISRLRIHTRLPVVIPQRITPELIETLSGLNTKIVMVLHCNHANELDPRVEQAAYMLRQAGVILLNQSVILRGVNDNPYSLATLSETLFNAGILPYYLFTLDRTKGTQHFEVPADQCRDIYRQLLTELPGYLVPKLVAEIPHRPSKTPLDIGIDQAAL